jgi:2-aminomuconate deaminase
MSSRIIVPNLDDPKPFCHSHASGDGNIYFTSGIVSRKDGSTGLNIGVSRTTDNTALVHNIEEQFLDIVDQLYEITCYLGLEHNHVMHSLLDVRVFIVDVKKHFKVFNSVYAQWMKDMESYPARTTVGVSALPSDVILEIAFTIEAS